MESSLIQPKVKKKSAIHLFLAWELLIHILNFHNFHESVYSICLLILKHDTDIIILSRFPFVTQIVI